MKFRKKNIYLKISQDLKQSLDDSEIDVLFVKAGVKFTTIKYNLIRYSVFFALFVVLVLQVYLKDVNITKGLISLIILFIGSIPKISFVGKTTPFGYGLKLIGNSFDDKKDLELFRTITQLKNLAIAQQDSPMGSDFIISQLMKFTVVTKPIFAQFLSLWRVGKEDEAYEYFVAESNTSLGKSFAGILIKLDSLNPIEMVQQLVLYQTHIREERATKIQKKQEAISNMIFIPILIVPLVILANFVYIVYALDTIKLLLNI